MTKLWIKYFSFAAIATAGNIIAQNFSILIYDREYSLYFAMAVGTFIGLVIKYLLDKKYIFYYKVDSTKADIKKFILYSLMGIITTIIFWTFELSFNYFLKFDSAKYFGAVIGLSIGYVMKYYLDKKFVFTKEE